MGGLIFGKRQEIDDFKYTPLADELWLFESYLNVMERFLAEEAQKRRAQLQAVLGTHYDNANDFIDARNTFEQLVQIVDSFTNILRRSFFVSLYTFLESQLVKECVARKGDDVLLRLSDLRGDEIDKVKTYMVKILRVSFPSASPEWQRIQSYRILRNCIVHNEGRLDERFDQRDAKSLMNYIANTPTLSLSGEKVVLSKDFCEEALQTVEQFFRLLYKP